MATRSSGPPPSDSDICPVCLKPIGVRDPVTIDHGEVIHADCMGKPPARRPPAPPSSRGK